MPIDYTTTLRKIEESTWKSYGHEDINRKCWIEEISKEPRAFIYHNLLTNDECEHLISLAKPNMVSSKVFNSITRGSVVSRFLHGQVRELFLEEDMTKSSKRSRRGFLIFTFIPKARGGTVFPKAKGNEFLRCGIRGLTVLPKKRDALLFWSMQPDTSLDPSSGLPVIKGNKWACTKWMRASQIYLYVTSNQMLSVMGPSQPYLYITGNQILSNAPPATRRRLRKRQRIKKLVWRQKRNGRQ